MEDWLEAIQCDVCGEEVGDGSEETCEECGAIVCIEDAVKQDGTCGGRLWFLCEPCHQKKEA